MVLAYQETNFLASKALFSMMCGNPRSQAHVADRRKLSVELSTDDLPVEDDFL